MSKIFKNSVFLTTALGLFFTTPGYSVTHISPSLKANPKSDLVKLKLVQKFRSQSVGEETGAQALDLYKRFSSKKLARLPEKAWSYKGPEEKKYNVQLGLVKKSDAKKMLEFFYEWKIPVRTETVSKAKSVEVRHLTDTKSDLMRKKS